MLNRNHTPFIMQCCDSVSLQTPFFLITSMFYTFMYCTEYNCSHHLQLESPRKEAWSAVYKLVVAEEGNVFYAFTFAEHFPAGLCFFILLTLPYITNVCL